MFARTAIVVSALLLSLGTAMAKDAYSGDGNGIETIVFTSKTRFAIVPGTYSSQLDFDGDGLADTVSVGSIRAGKESLLSRDVQISGLWGGQKIGTRAARRALWIMLNGSGRTFLLTDVHPHGGYFDTPLWSGTTPPISVAKRGSKAFKEFQKQEKRIRNDILVLGTEAGIEIALYWNGNTFALFQPAEEP